MIDTYKVMTTALVPCRVCFGFTVTEAAIAFKVLWWNFLHNLIDILSFWTLSHITCMMRGAQHNNIVTHQAD